MKYYLLILILLFSSASTSALAQSTRLTEVKVVIVDTSRFLDKDHGIKALAQADYIMGSTDTIWSLGERDKLKEKIKTLENEVSHLRCLGTPDIEKEKDLEKLRSNFTAGEKKTPKCVNIRKILYGYQPLKRSRH